MHPRKTIAQRRVIVTLISDRLVKLVISKRKGVSLIYAVLISSHMSHVQYVVRPVK
jgi:hypothetical protein